MDDDEGADAEAEGMERVIARAEVASVVPGSEVGPGSEPVMPPEATETGGGEPRRRGRTSGEALVAGVDERAGARKGAGRPRKS